MFDTANLTRQVLENCEISDARHAGLYSICGLALRLRDLYKWEMGLPPWEEKDSSEILEWIEAREQRWEKCADCEYEKISIGDRTYEPFDTGGINAVVAPHGLLYGAGYARGLKPTFFLARIEGKETVEGMRVYSLGRELARDLLTLPAFLQDGCILLRQEAAKMYLWDQMFYINKSAKPALRFALKNCGLQEPYGKVLQQNLAKVLAAQRENYIYHEIGEMRDAVFDRGLWREIIAAFPHTPVEFLVRAVKDLLADTNAHGTLQHIIRNRNAASLGLYVAFFDGLAKEVFPELRPAFNVFSESHDWQVVEEAMSAGYHTAKAHAQEIMHIYRTAKQKNNKKWAQHEIEKRLLDKIVKRP